MSFWWPINRSLAVVFRCAACGRLRRITMAGFREARANGEWKCGGCGGTSLEMVL